MTDPRPSILFVNQHYWPDFASTGQHLTDLAEHLAADGFDVHVLCSRGKYLAGKMELPKQEQRNGVTIRRVSATAFGRGSHLGRLMDYASFYLLALWHVLFGRRHDAVVMLTTPPLLGAIGALARAIRGSRYGIWSMDLHPDAEEAIGMIKPGSALSRLLHGLNGWGYRRADFVIDLGFVMKARLEAKGVHPDRLRTIPVWSDRNEIYPVAPADNPLRAELGLQNKFVVMYSGNAGLAHRFDEVMEAMRRLRDHPSVYFLFVGNGPRRAEIETFVQAEGLTNFRYLDYFGRDQLAQSLSLGDVHLLTLREDMAGIAVPGKLYGIMAAARPTVMVGPRVSEPAQVITSERVGELVVPGPDAGARLAGLLVSMASRPGATAATGARARQVFLDQFDRDVCCAQWASMLREHLGLAQPAPARTARPVARPAARRTRAVPA
ncbi:MAG: glycosyltransferase family 4 protein [Rubricoccaceae bacterium]